MVYLQQSKRDAALKIRYVKGVPFVTTGYTKGVPFLSKNGTYKGSVPGAEPLRIKLQWDPPSSPLGYCYCSVILLFNFFDTVLH